MRSIIASIVCVLGVVGAISPAHSDSEAVRVLIVGDSTTQGSAGDWTWRYRLWHHLKSNGLDVDFVGPRSDLKDLAADQYGSQDYADGSFDRDHASVWRAGYTSPPYPIAELVQDHRPDIVLVWLGINDLLGYQQDAGATLQRAQTFVDAAHSADPTVDVVVGDLPWSWEAGVSEFNSLLPRLTSVAGLAHVETFTQCIDTHDRFHLSAAGEMKTAAGFADALSAMGIGPPFPRPLQPVPPAPPHPAVVTAEAGAGAVILRWSLPPGAEWTKIWMRDSAGDGAWTALPGWAVGQSLTVAPLANHRTYEFRVQAGKGCITSDALSNAVRATPRPTAVEGLRAKAGRHRITVSWLPALGSARYRVNWSPGRKAITARTSFVIKRLDSKRRYRITVGAPGTSKPSRVFVRTR